MKGVIYQDRWQHGTKQVSEFNYPVRCSNGKQEVRFLPYININLNLSKLTVPTSCVGLANGLQMANYQRLIVKTSQGVLKYYKSTSGAMGSDQKCYIKGSFTFGLGLINLFGSPIAHNYGHGFSLSLIKTPGATPGSYSLLPINIPVSFTF